MNIIKKVNLSFAKSITGINEAIQVKRLMLCTTCAGKKVQKVENADQCPKCYGTGEHSDVVGEICVQCMGTGVLSISCKTCNGDGIQQNTMTLSVTIPKSVDTGMLLRIRDKGHQAFNGEFGDLILKV